jgi:glycosyltransferase involved in cell wall biosynthesis
MDGPTFVHAAVSLNPPTGVVRQMAYEASAASELGLNWTVWLYQGTDLGSNLSRWPAFLRSSLLRVRFYVALARRARRGHRIVLRHSSGDPFLFAASFFLGPYYTVHHTFEEDELAASRHPLAGLQLMLERLLGRRVVARARGIVCVTPEIAHHELRRLPARADRTVIIYPNGVLYRDDPEETVDRREEQPEVIFVASQFFDWHGLDLLLRSMSLSREAALLHLVGVLPDAVMRQAKSDSRVFLHGRLDPPQLRPLIARSWIGLSSFGLSTKGMTEACTLKTREYLRAGLPVYAGHRDSALPADFGYFREGPANWDAILEYARAVRAVPRTEVALAARPLIDKEVLLERLYRSLEGGSNVQDRSGIAA